LARSLEFSIAFVNNDKIGYLHDTLLASLKCAFTSRLGNKSYEISDVIDLDLVLSEAYGLNDDEVKSNIYLVRIRALRSHICASSFVFKPSPPIMPLVEEGRTKAFG